MCYFLSLHAQDDLASEGLLFIRMKSDQGRYGFNVKVLLIVCM